MAMYAIGDLQGCYAEFDALLARLDFSPSRDRLWLAGDLVNRGPGSLACLRRVKALEGAVETVLGNHDLHLLAVARGHGKLKRNDTLAEILDAPDREALMAWLRAQPLLLADPARNRVMTHAGLLPQWSLTEARELAAEAEAVLGGDAVDDFLAEMYGNRPARWSPQLAGLDRLRSIVNVFTRMRFIDAEGTLDFSAKEGLDSAPAGFAPWFTYPRQHPREEALTLLFGHWAALEGQTPGARVRAEALDTGCVWGGTLTALDLDSGERIAEPSQQLRR
ncbi:symmetrical bis(5'-nucleosyl)-tetraphosphatase [Salinicola sp. DM10]|uniref:symmetrical bis(5'-nucleosyl)-tetraphosphatase n=1 Tax=Salinicola sp. DM10 TaxID=2815721 RepID=UPI001A8F7D49|nr:symmetrical bis(5'-nucleosyl)-tetraphosphatase [Salinicola sp. DM10]MCE3028251.1 symmetrical bis(5'-nucleosyl)-tetraphosphatase [Salinicola sp. DM10]